MLEQPSSLTDWLEAVGTVGSLFVALSILMLDRRNRKKEQAKAIHSWVEVTDRERAKIRNLSAGPIADAKVYFRPWTIPEQIVDALLHPLLGFHRARRHGFWRPRTTPAWSWPFARGDEPWSQYVEPGEIHSSTIPNGVSTAGQRMHVAFKDAASNYWAIGDGGHQIRGYLFGYRREMRLNQTFLKRDHARRLGIPVRHLDRELSKKSDNGKENVDP
ncbi:hypothetical protein M1843_04925 [Isoptericola sp. 4D.3]|uniref:Uncharacterized protein n=1 Tax=Isoptericola peretonis TaxID=2918523 RepID=A0ABT0J0Q7_9MICO|nr:hypothetical protein [Isoptericola sp. 4D.3]